MLLHFRFFFVFLELRTLTLNKKHMGSIVYIVGVVLSVLAVIDIIKKPISVIGKVITAILVLATSWIGLAVYYLYAKNHLTEWFK